MSVGMIPFPQIQIRQTHAKLGFDADLGKLDMKQPRPTFEMKTNHPKVRIEQPNAEMRIDQSRAWDALGLGNNLETMRRIYTAARQVALQGIARRVDEGNQMAAIHRKTDAIVDIAEQQAGKTFELPYLGYASVDNVDIRFIRNKPKIQAVEGSVQINARVNRPEVNYHRGKLDIALLQYNKVEIIPPELDMRV